MATESSPAQQISVIIPARDQATTIGSVVRAILDQAPTGRPVEVLVLDDGSVDETRELAGRAGARVVSTGRPQGNPAAARNLGARLAQGDLLIFLDGDCLPESGWLAGLLSAQDRGNAIVGGSLTLPPGLSWTARCDYYSSAYHVHPGRRAGPVPNHTPANLSVRRHVFAASPGFTERFPVADGHEELEWQSAAAQRGAVVYFEPAARVQHFNRPGLGNLLRRSYRWGYSALEAKASSGATRLSLLYRHPFVALLAAFPLALLDTGYIIASWLHAGRFQVLQFAPVILLARSVYAGAFIVGGWHWLRRQPDVPGQQPRWR